MGKTCLVEVGAESDNVPPVPNHRPDLPALKPVEIGGDFDRVDAGDEDERDQTTAVILGQD